MVNAPSDLADPPTDGERRERPRLNAEHAAALGASRLNPFGDLVTMQHLSVRLAKALKGIFEPMWGRPVRSWAEPIAVERFSDYRADRGDALTAWLPLAIAPGKGRALIALDGKFVLELLDCYFGGEGEAPHPLPAAFTPAAEALIARIGRAIERPMAAAWESLAQLEFTPIVPDGGSAAPPVIDAGAAMVVTRFGLADGDAKPVHLDILYPVAALKPYSGSLMAKVHSRDADPEPGWRNALTRNVMNVKLPVRSVLAEPMIPVTQLMELQPGDIIPIAFGQHVPLFVDNHRFATGTVGTANGRAAIKIHALERQEEPK